MTWGLAFLIVMAFSVLGDYLNDRLGRNMPWNAKRETRKERAERVKRVLDRNAKLEKDAADYLAKWKADHPD